MQQLWPSRNEPDAAVLPAALWRLLTADDRSTNRHGRRSSERHREHARVGLAVRMLPKTLRCGRVRLASGTRHPIPALPKTTPADAADSGRGASRPPFLHPSPRFLLWPHLQDEPSAPKDAMCGLPRSIPSSGSPLSIHPPLPRPASAEGAFLFRLPARHTVRVWLAGAAELVLP